MYCKNCGKEAEEGKRFCRECGAPLDSKEEAPSAVQAPETQAAAPSAQAPSSEQTSAASPPMPGQAPPPPPGVGATPQPPSPPGIGAPPPAPGAPIPPPVAPWPGSSAAGAPAGPGAPMPPLPGSPGSAPRKKKTGIIAAVVAVLVIIVAALVVVFLISAGGDTSKTKDLINKASPVVNDAQTTLKEVGDQINTFFSEIAGITSTAQFESKAADIRSNVTAVEKDLNQAKGYLEDAVKLDAQADYKKYSEIALELVNTELEETKQITDYLDYLGKAFKDAEAGQPVNTTAISTTTQDFITTLRETNDKAKELADQAATLKKDKNL